MKFQTLFLIIRSYLFIFITSMRVQHSGNIVIIDFTKISINCHLQDDLIILVKSLIQCAKLCAFDRTCGGLQYHVSKEISDGNKCSTDRKCDKDDYNIGECILLHQEQIITATAYKNNTVIISKTRDLNQKNVKQCYAPQADVITTPGTKRLDCKFTAVVFINATKEIWIFTPLSVYIYNSTKDLGTELYNRKLVVELFDDLPGPVQSGYSQGVMLYLIVRSNIYTYNSTNGARCIKKETIYEHFRPDLPSQVDGLILNDRTLHAFSKNYIYDASNKPLVIKPFRSRSIYNPYRATYKGNRPKGVTAATGIGNNTYIFLDKTEFYLFRINSLRRGTQTGIWEKGKSPLQCHNKR